MKKGLSDVKSYVTVLFATALVILLFIAVFKSESIFETVFLLFTNLCTAVFTYFFTRKAASYKAVLFLPLFSLHSKRNLP